MQDIKFEMMMPAGVGFDVVCVADGTIESCEDLAEELVAQDLVRAVDCAQGYSHPFDYLCSSFVNSGCQYECSGRRSKSGITDFRIGKLLEFVRGGPHAALAVRYNDQS